MPAFNKFNCFSGDLATKVHNLNSDTLKFMLTDVAPVATNTVKANITEIAAANGYVAGGLTASFVSGADTNGVYKLVVGQPILSASGGAIAQFRYAVLYNSTPVAGNLIGWADYGAEVNIANGNSFQIQTDQTNGILTVT